MLRFTLVNALGVESENKYVRWFFCLMFWLCVGQLLAWASQHTPPFEVISYETASVKRGDTAFVVVKVKRDLGRKCYVTFSRYLFDSKGYRYAFGKEESMTPSGLTRLENLNPGELRLALPIPDSISPGTARYVTDLSYRCNPFHVLQPVAMTMEIPLEILP